MAATTMEKITSTLEKLRNNPRVIAAGPLAFEPGDDFHWNHETRTVYYQPTEDGAEQLLLHETGHALLNHAEYPDDIILVAMERAAWDTALELGKDTQVTLDDDFVEMALDSYRDWLHARSTCPNCHSLGVQKADKLYACLACGHEWTVNEARVCALRRHDITKHP